MYLKRHFDPDSNRARGAALPRFAAVRSPVRGASARMPAHPFRFAAAGDSPIAEWSQRGRLIGSVGGLNNTSTIGSRTLFYAAAYKGRRSDFRSDVAPRPQGMESLEPCGRHRHPALTPSRAGRLEARVIEAEKPSSRRCLEEAVRCGSGSLTASLNKPQSSTARVWLATYTCQGGRKAGETSEALRLP